MGCWDPVKMEAVALWQPSSNQLINTALLVQLWRQIHASLPQFQEQINKALFNKATYHKFIVLSMLQQSRSFIRQQALIRRPVATTSLSIFGSKTSSDRVLPTRPPTTGSLTAHYNQTGRSHKRLTLVSC